MKKNKAYPKYFSKILTFLTLFLLTFISFEQKTFSAEEEDLKVPDKITSEVPTGSIDEDNEPENSESKAPLVPEAEEGNEIWPDLPTPKDQPEENNEKDKEETRPSQEKPKNDHEFIFQSDIKKKASKDKSQRGTDKKPKHSSNSKPVKKTDSIKLKEEDQPVKKPKRAEKEHKKAPSQQKEELPATGTFSFFAGESFCLICLGTILFILPHKKNSRDLNK